MTTDEFVEFLEPLPERPDPKHPGQTLPKRAGAICQSTADYGAIDVALADACRELGSRCSYELKGTIRAVHAKIRALHQRALKKSAP